MLLFKIDHGTESSPVRNAYSRRTGFGNLQAHAVQQTDNLAVRHAIICSCSGPLDISNLKSLLELNWCQENEVQYVGIA